MSGSLSPWPVVATGHSGHPVKTLQFLLRARGHTVTVDGIFGPQTDVAVKGFPDEQGFSRQRNRGSQYLDRSNHPSQKGQQR